MKRFKVAGILLVWRRRAGIEAQRLSQQVIQIDSTERVKSTDHLNRAGQG